MSHPRPWEELDSDNIQFGEVTWQAAEPAEAKRSLDWRIEQFSLQVPKGEVASKRDRQVVVESQVWETLRQHALQDPHRETGGLLLGYPFLWDQASAGDTKSPPKPDFDLGLWICHALPGQHLDSTPTRLTFTYQTWQQWSRDRVALPSQWGIVGWYHTHPGWGVFLSEWDQFLCRHYFAEPKQVAIVIDPIHDGVGCFEWELGPLRPDACMVARRHFHHGLQHATEPSRENL